MSKKIIEEGENQDEYSPESTENNGSSFKWDFSILIALFAILISTLSAFISLKESNIMKRQQEILAEQQEASVWPYIHCTNIHDYENESSVEYSFIVRNKGIGPAIIDSVKYVLNGKSIQGWHLASELSEIYPDVKIDALSNQTLDFNVLAPGDIHHVIKIRITSLKESTVTVQQITDEMDFHLEFCYCSVYGKCWKVIGMDNTIRSADCLFRENIR